MTPPLVYLLVKSGEGLPYLVNEEEATTASDEEIMERARSVLKGGFDTTTIAGKDLEKHHQHSVTVRQTTDINLVRMDSETFIYSRYNIAYALLCKLESLTDLYISVYLYMQLYSSWICFFSQPHSISWPITTTQHH